MRRRDLLAGGVALLAGCGVPAAAPVGEAPASKNARVPFRVIDLMPELFAYCDEAKGLSAADARALFVRRIVGPHADVYAPRVLRLPSDQADALDRRLDVWLPTVPALVDGMRRIHDTFVAELDVSTARFIEAFPDFAWSGDLYLIPSLDSFNGAARLVGGRPALLFGLDVIAKSQPNAKLSVLMHHELFHFYQDSTTDFVASSLWIEGLATYASLTLDSHATADDALPFSHIHRRDDPQLDAPSRRVMLSREMPARVSTLGPRLLASLRSTADDDYADFFLGRATPRMDGQPVRSGYWFGLELARRIARGKDLRALAAVRPSALLGDMERELERLIAEHR
ncbi:MAG: hypothetical protein JWO86_6225 [Myxococcaceae bacterium]|nr:hypothetical protein [Myxococcaceae bacterium]MEA2751176.1 hypothetical protein [Myxococcales bacterium]